jgi:hypothetical protein
MGGNTYRLVNHDEVGILEENRDDDVFLIDLFSRRKVNLNKISSTYSIGLLDRSARFAICNCTHLEEWLERASRET